jgi:hypothetical protein
VFRWLNKRLVAKSPRSMVPGPTLITYDLYLRFFSLWFFGVMVVSLKLSGRSLLPSPDGVGMHLHRPMRAFRRSYGANAETRKH